MEKDLIDNLDATETLNGIIDEEEINFNEKED